MQNKINALEYSEYAASEGGDLDSKYSDLHDRLLELDWTYLYGGSYDDMIERLDSENYKGFDDLEEDHLKKWLEFAYENNHDDFVKFKENFVTDFNEIIGKDAYGYSTYNTLNKEEVAYINDLVAKVESAGYKKVKDQMALNLDSVGSHRYLNKILGS